MVGRKKEIQELNDLYSSGMAEFVAIYGRRRVGKTYLVDQTFEGRITFRHTGISPVEYGKKGEGLLKAQLKSFHESMVRQNLEADHCPRDWMEAFFMLSMALQKTDDGSRQLVFLDELPWMDTPRSFFVTALENFWNGWACHRSNFMLVVCGSANSWILNKLVNNHGGLYGRLTYQIKLSPFTLGECEEYFESRNIDLSRYDIVQSYMIMGGIPYYMGYMRRQKSLSQNIDDMFLLEDKFVLTYLRGDMKAAQGQIALLLDKCCLEAPVMAMVFDCLLSQNLVCDANSALERRIKELHDYDYNVNSEIHRLQKAFSRESYRKRLIASYRYDHPAIFQYYYLE